MCVDLKTGFCNVTRISDGRLLLRQTGLSFGSATKNSFPGAYSVVVTFEGLKKNETIFGFGEHRNSINISSTQSFVFFLPLTCCLLSW